MKNKKYIYVLALFILSQISFAQDTSNSESEPSNFDHRLETEKFVGFRYYYYPNLFAYYDTRRGLYYFKQGDSWITSENIPTNYRGYGMNNGTYIELKGFYDEEPYKFVDQHKEEYPSDYSGKRKTKVIFKNN